MSSNYFKRVGDAMSKWLEDTLALVTTVANGTSGQAKTDKAVADLIVRMDSDDMEDAEYKQAFDALVKALAVAPAPGSVPSPAPAPAPAPAPFTEPFA